MPIADDWDIDFIDKVISHVDGVLSYDTNTGTAPADGDYVRGTNSGAIGKIIAGSDLGGTNGTGTLTLTNVIGKFEDNDPLEVMASLAFDNVTSGNGGFAVGDVIDGPTTESITVRAIEYNLGTAGEGTIYGDNVTSGFTDGEQLDINGGQTDVADANGVETTPATFTGALANGTLAVPGTANTNNSVIIHYDAGTIDIPEGATIEDASTGAIGFAQQVYGVTATGSVRVINSDTTGGAWTDNNTLRADMVIAYDGQVAGQVFSVGDVVVGASSGATGRVLADTGTELILADESGTWTNNEDLEVGGTKIADANGTNTTLNLATINIPGGVRTTQRASQGGIYDASDSVNIVRSFNELYTYIQDTFDELGQLDDNEPMTAQVKDQAYTLVNGWQIPDLSMRFLESGSVKDSSNNNIFANIQTLGTVADITNQGFLYDSTQPTPQPNFYIEQNAAVIRQDWIEGNINMLVKVKTSTDPRYIDPTVNTLGQLINGGSVTVFAREYLRTYDNFTFTNTTGGFVAVPIATADDLDNSTGQYVMAYDGGSAATLEVGEEITAGTDISTDVLKVGIVTAQTGDAGATGTVTYVLKSGTQFADNDAVTADVSGKTFNVDETGGFDSTNDVVAGYNTDIRIMTVDQNHTGGTTTGTYIIGEQVSDGGGWTGYILEDDSGTLYTQTASGTPNDTVITGATSGATNTPTANAADTQVPKDIGLGTDLNYNAVISGDITGADPQVIENVYEWAKFVTRSESTSTEGGPGSSSGISGNIYRYLVSTYAEKKASPYGTFAGGTMFGAQGVFIDKDTLDATDIRSISLLDELGATVTPPNLQTLAVTSLVAGDRVSVYRSTGASSTTIEVGEFSVGTVGGGNNQSADSTILLTDGTRTATPDDVPDTGVLRILDPNNTGLYLRFPYSAVNRSTHVYTLASGTIGAVTGAQDLTASDNAFVVFIEEQSAGTSVSNTVIYVSDVPLLVRVRVKGILPFQTTSTFASTGASIGAVRTTDSIVNLP